MTTDPLLPPLPDDPPDEQAAARMPATATAAAADRVLLRFARDIAKTHLRVSGDRR
jgi:hypothetical protein